MALNQKQLNYAKERANGVAPREAAIAAGYAANSAHVTASRMDQREDIKKAIAKFKRNPDSRLPATESADEDAVKPILKDKYPTSLALLQDLYNNPKASMGVRIEAAKLALPYEHGKKAETGKKETLAENAKSKTQAGRFAQKRGPGRPPLRVVN